jgi:tRNA modification GTPase
MLNNNTPINHFCVIVRFVAKTFCVMNIPLFNAMFYYEGLSKSAIAVIRVSGPKSLDVIHRMTRRKKDSVIPRKALLCRIVDPKNEEMLDNGIVLWFPQPHSFTGEDSVELHVHGGVAVVSSVINALHKLPGFRLAEAGISV